MKKYTITEKKTGKKYTVSALNESDARSKVKTYISEQKNEDKQLEMYVKNAVKQSLNEAMDGVEEGIWGAMKGLGQGVKDAWKNSGIRNRMAYGSAEQERSRNTNRANKGGNKAVEAINKNIIPTLKKYGIISNDTDITKLSNSLEQAISPYVQGVVDANQKREYDPNRTY